MNPISRRTAAETAEALLEVGRTDPVLHYDVELGLERHHHWLRNEAPMPEWACAGMGNAAKPLVPLAIKTIVSAVFLGALGAAAWQVRSRPQPSAAEVNPTPPAAEATHAVAPSVPDVTASEAWMATTPMPVAEPELPPERPARRNVRADKHSTRAMRARKEVSSARASMQRTESTEPAPPREEAAPASNPASVERTEVVASPERKAISTTPKPRPAPAHEAQSPDDLVEMQQVATAEQLLEHSPQRALGLVRQGDQRFARGYFQQERAYIAIMALIRLGRIDEARMKAASFAKQFPPLPYGARIRSALEAREAPAPASRDAVR